MIFFDEVEQFKNSQFKDFKFSEFNFNDLNFNFDELKFCDAHLHLSDLKEIDFNSDFFSLTQKKLSALTQFEFLKNKNYFCASSAHFKNDFYKVELISKNCDANILQTFGLHPQNILDEPIQKLDFLESLLKEKKIAAIGECGFDFFTPQFLQTRDEQIKFFNEQLTLAKKYNVPLLIHARKCIDLLFTYAKDFAKLPSVIFHSFPGTFLEAQFFLKHDVNAAFSFSKQILNNNKKAINCTKNLPIKNLLLETDAPYQKLKNEDSTKIFEIIKVYFAAFFLRQNSFKIEKINFEEFIKFTETIYLNYSNFFCNIL